MILPNRLFVSMVLLMQLLACEVASAQQRQWEMVKKATLILDEVIAKNKKGLPPLALRHAYAVAIFPDRIKGGFLVGGSYGEGVVLVQKADGAWSFPILVSLGGGSFGLQVGVQSSDLILIYKNRQTVDSFLQGKGKLLMGVDGSLALGGLGGSGALGTGAGMKSQYVAFSRSRGLFAGASVTGAGMTINWDGNAVFYGQPVGPQDIMQDRLTSVPEPALTLQTLLMQKSRLVPLSLPVAEDPAARFEGGVEEAIIEDKRVNPAPTRIIQDRRTPPVDRGEELDLEPLPPPDKYKNSIPSSEQRKPSKTEEPPLRFTKVEQRAENPPVKFANTDSSSPSGTSSGWYRPASSTYRRTSMPDVPLEDGELAPPAFDTP